MQFSFFVPPILGPFWEPTEGFRLEGSWDLENGQKPSEGAMKAPVLHTSPEGSRHPNRRHNNHSQRVHLDCQYGFRSQKPHII